MTLYLPALPLVSLMWAIALVQKKLVIAADEIVADIAQIVAVVVALAAAANAH